MESRWHLSFDWLLVSVILGILHLWSGVSFGYTGEDVRDAQMRGVATSDAEVLSALTTLHEHKLLTGWSRTLQALDRLSNTKVVREALSRLSGTGVLEAGKDVPRAGAAFLKHLRAQRLAESDDNQGSGALNVAQLSQLVMEAPYFIRDVERGVFRFGGLADSGTRLHPLAIVDGGGPFVEVILPGFRHGFIHERYLDGTANEVVIDPPPTRVQSSRPDHSTRSRRRNASDPGDSLGKILAGLKGPFSHSKIRHNGASLSVMRVELDRDFKHTILPYSIANFNLISPVEVPPQPLDLIARQGRALGAVNGTFFVQQPGTSEHGKPLGPIIANGKVVWSYREKRVLAMKRSYLAITDKNRAFIGDTDLTAEEILEGEKAGTFAPEKLRGERLAYLIGGLGWLVQSGDSDVYRRAQGHQFALSYYSEKVRRPQTVCALSADGRTVWLVAQEGKPHSRRPMPLPELASFLARSFPCSDAVFLDGGGSTQMVIDGEPVTRPENNGRQRRASTALMVTGLRPSSFLSETGSVTRFPGPEQPEPFTVPGNDRLWFHEDERLLPSGEDLRGDNPEATVHRGQARSRLPAQQDRNLLPQQQILGRQL